MRPLVFVALLSSTVALGGTDIPVAQKKQELAALARLAATELGTYEYYLDQLQPIPNRKLQALEMLPFVLFVDEGWGAITQKGVWSLGERSSLFIRLEEGARPKQLLIQGVYLNGQEPTRLFVNGELLSETSLQDHTVDLPPGLENSSHLHIELQHMNAAVHNETQPSSPDARKSNFRLQQIRVW